MSFSDEELQEMAVKEETTFWGYLGCELVELTDEQAEIRLVIKDHHLNGIGIVHGGVISSLLDNAMGIISAAARKGVPLVTSNMNVHFVAPLSGPIAIAIGRVMHASNKTLTCYAEVRNEEGQACALATGTFRVLRK